MWEVNLGKFCIASCLALMTFLLHSLIMYPFSVFCLCCIHYSYVSRFNKSAFHLRHEWDSRSSCWSTTHFTRRRNYLGWRSCSRHRFLQPWWPHILYILFIMLKCCLFVAIHFFSSLQCWILYYQFLTTYPLFTWYNVPSLFYWNIYT